MQEISILETKLTELQENILIEISKTVNFPFICKKLSIKPITLTKAMQSLIEKEFILNQEVTEKGKKMVHYLDFRNETISLFLKKHNIPNTTETISQLNKLDYKIIIALRNIL